MFVSEYFDASLSAKLTADAILLPLDDGAMADLLNLLTDSDDYTFLAIKSEQSYEVVKAHKEGGLIALDRGQEGTTAVLHPMGACVATVSPLTLAVMKDIVCNYECCQTDCVCEPVTFGSAMLPTPVANKEYVGAVIFNGDLPITIGVNDATSSWITVTQEGRIAKLSGMPTGTSGRISLAAANCNGKYVTGFDTKFGDS